MLEVTKHPAENKSDVRRNEGGTNGGARDPAGSG
jgi:hypothetical protein